MTLAWDFVDVSSFSPRGLLVVMCQAGELSVVWRGHRFEQVIHFSMLDWED